MGIAAHTNWPAGLFAAFPNRSPPRKAGVQDHEQDERSDHNRIGSGGNAWHQERASPGSRRQIAEASETYLEALGSDCSFSSGFGAPS